LVAVRRESLHPAAYVLEHYNLMFSLVADGTVGLGCDREAPQCLSGEDKVDLIDYMQLLSFEETTARLQEP
jgi:hypothetical protein